MWAEDGEELRAEKEQAGHLEAKRSVVGWRDGSVAQHLLLLQRM